MKAQQRLTGWLVGILAFLLTLDLASQWAGPEELPASIEVPAVDFQELAGLRLVQAAATLEFEREDDAWRIVSPFEAAADKAALNAIRRQLHAGFKIELKIEENSDDLKVFGLEPGLRLEAFTDSEVPALVLYVGRDTTGGATFVRLPDDTSVYRAQIGGRARYDRPAPAWRDPVVAPFAPDTVLKLHLDTPTGSNHFERHSPTEPWTLSGSAEFPVDQLEISSLLTGLAGLRAGAVLSPTHPAGLELPTVTVTLHTSESPPISLSFGRTLAGAFAKNEAKDDIYQIAPSFTERLARPRAAWFDRLLFDFDRTQIHRMTLSDPQQGDTVLEQDPATNRWRVLKPANVDVNLRDCMQAALAVAQLRAVAMASIPPAEAGFPSRSKLTVTGLSGSTWELEMGRRVPGMPKGQEALFVRTTDTPDRIAVVPLRTLLKIRTAFSR
jgi:hypothetical protein